MQRIRRSLLMNKAQHGRTLEEPDTGETVGSSEKIDPFEDDTPLVCGLDEVDECDSCQ